MLYVRLAANGTVWNFPKAMSREDLEFWRRYLDDVARAGYEGIEHLPPHAPIVDVALLRQELDQRGLALAGLGLYGALETPEGRASLEEQVRCAAPFATKLGADYLYVIDEMYADVATGELNAPARLDGREWTYLIESVFHLNDLARDLSGLPLLVHPHEFTHIDTLEQIERFLDDTDPHRISLLFDVGHCVYASGDPATFYRQHHERIGQLHLKNVQRTLLPDHSQSLVALVATGAFADLATGDVDFARLHEALEASGYSGWLTVEMLRGSEATGAPLDTAAKALRYLRELGYGPP